MKEHRRLLVLALALAAAGGLSAASRAATVTIDEVATPDEVRKTREVILQQPPPFKRFIDRLSVPVPAVTLGGGDTVHFHLALEEPYRFAIAQTANVFTVGLEMTSTATGTPAAQSGDPPTVVLEHPDNIRPEGARYSAYNVDSGTGRVMSLSIFREYGTRPPVAVATAVFDPTEPSLFSGFDGTAVLPASFPTTTFDGGVSLVVTGELDRGVDPPPTLAYITTVPEPGSAMTTALTVALAGLCAARPARRPE
jgi:hypothetical protein